jgi:hypothetical protein
MTYEQFKARLTRSKEPFEKSERHVQLTEADLAPFRALPERLDVLVIVTETCPDVIMNLPILNRVATETGKLNPRIFLRDDNQAIMADYMNGPYASVPVFAFFDQRWTELGVWIERPRSVTELRTARTRQIHESNPEFGPPGTSPTELPEAARERLHEAIRRMRAETQAVYARETIRDIGEMMRDFQRGSGDGRSLWRGNLAAVPV